MFLFFFYIKSCIFFFLFHLVTQFINLMEAKLEENNINLSHCIQRSLCTYAQEKFVKNGSKVGGAHQIVDGIFR